MAPVLTKLTESRASASGRLGLDSSETDYQVAWVSTTLLRSEYAKWLVIQPPRRARFRAGGWGGDHAGRGPRKMACTQTLLHGLLEINDTHRP